MKFLLMIPLIRREVKANWIKFFDMMRREKE